MSYQPCRWYDLHPKLAFAFKMLYFAPDSIQRRAIAQLRQLINEQWELVQPGQSKMKGKRWYDQHDEAAGTVELIRNGPDALKQRAGETLLTLLLAETA
ncbi:MAG TPA: hypothetical protein V6C99_04025 [Oculatellaceae cyanobacterium]|jgi:hypothetical protein